MNGEPGRERDNRGFLGSSFETPRRHTPDASRVSQSVSFCVSQVRQIVESSVAASLEFPAVVVSCCTIRDCLTPCETNINDPRLRQTSEIAAGVGFRALVHRAMKLSPLTHQADAHDDGVWAVAWSRNPEGDDLLLTGSVDEGVKSWRATSDGLEMVHSYIGTSEESVCANGQIRRPARDTRRSRLETRARSCVPRVARNPRAHLYPPREIERVRSFGFSHRAPTPSLGLALTPTPPSAPRARNHARPPRIPLVPPNPEGHTLGVVSLAASPDGVTVASSALDSHIRVWNASTHETRVVIAAPPAEIWKITFVPDSSDRGASSLLAVAAGAAQAVKLYGVGEDAPGAEKAVLRLPDAGSAARGWSSSDSNVRFAQSVAVSGDGARVACGASDGTVALFDTRTGRFLHALEGHDACVRALAFSPDGKTLYTACDDGHCHVYDAENRSLLEALPGHEGWVLGVAAARDGNAIATCGADACVKLWDLRERRCAQSTRSQKEAVWDVAFGANDVLAACGDDRSVATFQYVP